ncbi:MAG TPA: hypothetical protein VNZ52_04970 [Candidatus Thermoplasmatota archaeon]|nr:hypothetical protein [Candidatus Thermoplasmatota archaeon]
MIALSLVFGAPTEHSDGGAAIALVVPALLPLLSLVHGYVLLALTAPLNILRDPAWSRGVTTAAVLVAPSLGAGLLLILPPDQVGYTLAGAPGRTVLTLLLWAGVGSAVGLLGAMAVLRGRSRA